MEQTNQKINVRLRRQEIIEYISMIESCYDLYSDENKEEAKLLAYLKKRIGW